MPDVPVTIARPSVRSLRADLRSISLAKEACYRQRNVEGFLGWQEDVDHAIQALDVVEAKLQDVLVERLGRDGMKDLILHNRIM